MIHLANVGTGIQIRRKQKITPLCPPYNKPCEIFNNRLKQEGIYLPEDATASNWLDKLPPAAREYFLSQEKTCEKRPGETSEENYWMPAIPYYGKPMNQGRFIGTFNAMSVSGSQTQIGMHPETDDGTGFGAIIFVSASITFTISYVLEVYENLVTTIINKSTIYTLQRGLILLE